MRLRDTVASLRALMTRGSYKYSTLPDSENATSQSGSISATSPWHLHRFWPGLKLFLVAMMLAVIAYLIALYARGSCASCVPRVCDTPEKGYQCKPALSHSWGQYSPFYAVPSEIDPSIPQGCDVTFALMLSRHGARDPTAGKTATYSKLIDNIHAKATAYGPGFEFIEDYNYTLGADLLSPFGQEEMVRSGTKFYQRYQNLASRSLPFIRSAGQDRVVQSAQNWTTGFHQALLADSGATAPSGFPYDIIVIPEEAGVNNSLSHGLCTAFEDGPFSRVGDDAQAKWVSIFTPALQDKLNKNLPGANLTSKDVISFLDLCPFNTVVDGTISPFCRLFTADEWHQYDYYEALGKWYGYGPGNPLGATQGVGFVNELLARLTGMPVVDHTTTNRTLDADPTTFPLDRALYADFSHDNDMTGVLAALGLYNATVPLSTEMVQSAETNGGYSASWTVPFAARIYVEKMTCGGSSNGDELVRILVNDRVVPLQGCGADALGRCTLGKFVESQSFARKGGLWDQCFVPINVHLTGISVSVPSHAVVNRSAVRSRSSGRKVRARRHKKEHHRQSVPLYDAATMNVAGLIIGLLILAVLLAGVGWIIFTRRRASQLGLPPPPLSSYIPFRGSSSGSYGAPQPAPGGIQGWFSDRLRSFKNRNNRSAAGAYEQSGSGAATRGRQGFSPLDPDEAWDSRIGHDGGYGPSGYYEEQELGLQAPHGNTSYAGGGSSYPMNLAVTPGHAPDGFGHAEEDRGRSRGRTPAYQGSAPAAGRNPFDDDVEPSNLSLRGVSPRPIDTAATGTHGTGPKDPASGESPTERRSIFRENV